MNKIKIVVPVSGGKDSQACLKLAVSKYEKHEILGLLVKLICLARVAGVRFVRFNHTSCGASFPQVPH